MSQRQIIYIPGLGDPYGQEKFLFKIWRSHNVRVHYFPSRWSRRGETFAIKFKRLTKLCEELIDSGKPVSIIGTSAGASLALNCYAKYVDSIMGVVLICGKVHNPQTIGVRTYRRNPAFRKSLDNALKSLEQLTPKQRSRIMSIHPLIDKSVPPADTIIDGAVEKRIFSIGHVPSIAYALTAGKWSILRFLRQFQ